jgi:hypothetical protein
VAHREKWTMQSAPNPYSLGASQHQASRLTQTCAKEPGAVQAQFRRLGS